jgi:transcriptional regulator with XRE-family HTH domain
MSVSSLLRSARKQAGLSQQELADIAGVSQRHLSFVESGRAKPGKEVVEALARGLKLAPAATNLFLELAGFAALFPQRRLDAAEMKPLYDASRLILASHLPAAAVLVDEAYDVLDANVAFDRMLKLIGDPTRMWNDTHRGRAKNLLRLTLHPKGPWKALTNFEEVARAALMRATSEAERWPRLRTVLTDIRDFPNLKPSWWNPLWGPARNPLVVERYQTAAGPVSILAVTTSVGAPIDAQACGWSIESYLPADDASRRVLFRSGLTKRP